MERTGRGVLCNLWPYVLINAKSSIYIPQLAAGQVLYPQPWQRSDTPSRRQCAGQVSIGSNTILATPRGGLRPSDPVNAIWCDKAGYAFDVRNTLTPLHGGHLISLAPLLRDAEPGRIILRKGGKAGEATNEIPHLHPIRKACVSTLRPLLPLSPPSFTLLIDYMAFSEMDSRVEDAEKLPVRTAKDRQSIPLPGSFHGVRPLQSFRDRHSPFLKHLSNSNSPCARRVSM